MLGEHNINNLVFNLKIKNSDAGVAIVPYSKNHETQGYKIIYFESEDEMVSCELPEARSDIIGCILPDENSMVFMQNKFPHINMEIGSLASCISHSGAWYRNYEKVYDVSCIVNSQSIDDYYQIISKLTYLKWIIVAEDKKTYQFFKSLNINNLFIIENVDDTSIFASKCFLVFPHYNRFPPKIIGDLLLENIPLIVIQNENFYDGHRNISYWDELVVSATSIMTSRFLAHERLAWYLEMCTKGKNWIKARKYYEEFLGFKSIINKFDRCL